MKTYLDCYPCLMRQALQASRFAKLNESTQQLILNAVMQSLIKLPEGTSPPVIAQHIHRIVREHSRHRDPYRTVKNNQHK